MLPKCAANICWQIESVANMLAKCLQHTYVLKLQNMFPGAAQRLQYVYND